MIACCIEWRWTVDTIAGGPLKAQSVAQRRLARVVLFRWCRSVETHLTNVRLWATDERSMLSAYHHLYMYCPCLISNTKKYYLASLTQTSFHTHSHLQSNCQNTAQRRLHHGRSCYSPRDCEDSLLCQSPSLYMTPRQARLYPSLASCYSSQSHYCSPTWNTPPCAKA